MNDSRKKMLERVRAIMAKTMANGCTEGEAMAALEKARELMAAYDISEADLGHTTPQEGATIHRSPMVDPYNIRQFLSVAVGQFTGCKAWWGHTYGVSFCGLESEVAFATWLLDTLQVYVLRALKEHLAERKRQGLSNPRIVSRSFALGACQRINARLAELSPKASTSPNANALVLSRNALIDAAMAAAGVHLKNARNYRTTITASAHSAGAAAGNAARFDRPMGHGGTLRLT